MSILTSKVPRQLEAKTRLFGFELGDLLIIFFYMAVSNFAFGHTRLKWLFVWGATAGLAALLHFTKRGKPENFLEHAVQYVLAPARFCAGAPDLSFQAFGLEGKYGTRS